MPVDALHYFMLETMYLYIYYYLSITYN